MKTDELRNIPIEEVLSKYGHEPVRRYGGYLMYRSPFREDHAPSFRVTLSGNHWRDYGDDSHGSVIDLVMRMEHCDTGSAIRKLASGHFTSGPVAHTVRDSKEVSVTSKMKVLNIVPLRNRVLLDYARGRGIDADIVQKFCQEVYYCFDKNRKPCFALGFPNDAGGLELRSSMFKGCHTAKAVSTLNKGHVHCVVFEGFFDLLSFLQYARDHPELRFPSLPPADEIPLPPAEKEMWRNFRIERFAAGIFLGGGVFQREEKHTPLFRLRETAASFLLHLFFFGFSSSPSCFLPFFIV